MYSAVKRSVNHWMHKPVNIRRPLDACAIYMQNMPGYNVYSIFRTKVCDQLVVFSCFSALLCSLHNHSSV